MWYCNNKLLYCFHTITHTIQSSTPTSITYLVEPPYVAEMFTLFASFTVYFTLSSEPIDSLTYGKKLTYS